MRVPYGLNRSQNENPLYPPDVDSKRHVMTCCHYVIFRTYCDILIEFSCNLYCSGSAKSLNIEVCSKEIAPRQFQAVLRFLKQNYILPVWGKSRHAYIHGAARFWRVRPMTSINTALNLKNKGYDFGEQSAILRHRRRLEGRFLQPFTNSCMF